MGWRREEPADFKTLRKIAHGSISSAMRLLWAFLESPFCWMLAGSYCPWHEALTKMELSMNPEALENGLRGGCSRSTGAGEGRV